jgi:hypothetical protein
MTRFTSCVPRIVSALLAAAATADAQPTPQVTLQTTWRAWPSNNNLVLMYMDSAEVWVNAQVSPPVGSPVSYSPPPGNGAGIVAGLGSVQFDLRACDVPAGAWTLSGTGFHGATGTNFGLRSPWSIGTAGTPHPSGDVMGCVASQYLFTPSSPNPANPVQEIWRGKWDYGQFVYGRWLRFTLVPVSATVVVHYDTINGVPQYAAVPASVSAATPVEIFMDTGAPPPCFVFVNTPPQNATVYSGAPASFTVGIQQAGTGCTPPAYRWRRDCALLTDDGRITGSSSPALAINPVQFSDAGRYDVRIGGVHSYTATLTVLCYPNCDGSSSAPTLNVQDFTCFLQRYAAGETYANCDQSTLAPVLNVQDFTCFLQRYAAGCP